MAPQKLSILTFTPKGKKHGIQPRVYLLQGASTSILGSQSPYHNEPAAN